MPNETPLQLQAQIKAMRGTAWQTIPAAGGGWSPQTTPISYRTAFGGSALQVNGILVRNVGWELPSNQSLVLCTFPLQYRPRMPSIGLCGAISQNSAFGSGPFFSLLQLTPDGNLTAFSGLATISQWFLNQIYDLTV